MNYVRKISHYHTRPQHRTKLKEIDKLGDANLVNSSNFIGTTLKFAEKFDYE